MRALSAKPQWSAASDAALAAAKAARVGNISALAAWALLAASAVLLALVALVYVPVGDARSLPPALLIAWFSAPTLGLGCAGFAAANGGRPWPAAVLLLNLLIHPVTVVVALLLINVARTIAS
ncbi:MAG: hypothetical protein HYS13_17240 [Planctomycetia bacterium]|nr:hypothetical protein [Planctomycetia bacterium]